MSFPSRPRSSIDTDGLSLKRFGELSSVEVRALIDDVDPADRRWLKFITDDDGSPEWAERYKAKCDRHWTDGTKFAFGIVVPGGIAGNVNLYGFDPESESAELGIWMAASFKRRGAARAAVRLLAVEAFERFSLRLIRMRLSPENGIMASFAARCGFADGGSPPGSRADGVGHRRVILHRSDLC